MWKNKHVIVALIVAPILSILAWFAVGAIVGDQAKVAEPGTAYLFDGNTTTAGKTLDVGAIGLGHDQLPKMGDCPDQTRFDPRTWWPDALRDRPLELEIGSGKGTFLVQQAERHRRGQSDVAYR